MNKSYIVIKANDWENLKRKIRRINADLIPTMDEMAKPIELDNHHNAAMCPYCTPKHTLQITNTPEPGGQWSRVGDTDYG